METINANINYNKEILNVSINETKENINANIFVGGVSISYFGFFGAQFNQNTSLGKILKTTKFGNVLVSMVWAYDVTWSEKLTANYN